MKQTPLFPLLARYNFWEKPPEALGYIRRAYLDRLGDHVGNRLIKVLVGQRRAGKSVLMLQLIHRLITQNHVSARNILYINFELEHFAALRDKQALQVAVEQYIKTIKPRGRRYLFFDEIQEVPGWEKIINSLAADTTLNAEVFITGSNSNMLSSELATYLSGRFVCINVYPFSFPEFIAYTNTGCSKVALQKYLTFSGIPQLYQLDSETLQHSFMQALRDTILFNDVIRRHKIQAADLLEKTFAFLVDNIGNLFSLNSLVKKLKAMGVTTNAVTLGNYVRAIEQALLIYGVSRYDVKGKRILEGEKKYYLGDLGFKTFLSSTFDPGLGKVLENYVFNALQNGGYRIYVGTLGHAEVDFVAEKKDRKLYVQVCYDLTSESVIQREYAGLEKISDHWEKIVVSMDDIRLRPKNGIRHVQAWTFHELI